MRLMYDVRSKKCLFSFKEGVNIWLLIERKVEETAGNLIHGVHCRTVGGRERHTTLIECQHLLLQAAQQAPHQKHCSNRITYRPQ